MYTDNFLLIMTYKFILNEYISIFLLRNSNVVFFFLFSKRVQILEKEYKYGQYCTALSQSAYIYIFV